MRFNDRRNAIAGRGVACLDGRKLFLRAFNAYYRKLSDEADQLAEARSTGMICSGVQRGARFFPTLQQGSSWLCFAEGWLDDCHRQAIGPASSKWIEAWTASFGAVPFQRLFVVTDPALISRGRMCPAEG